MSKADLCPVCKGSGKGPWIGAKEESEYAPKGGWLPCHGCHGMGWVEVGKEERSPVPDHFYVIPSDWKVWWTEPCPPPYYYVPPVTCQVWTTSTGGTATGNAI